MFEILTIILFIGMLYKVIPFTFKMTWGIAKMMAVLLIIFALPSLIIGLIFVGGFILFIPVVTIAAVYGIAQVLI